jgi:hypothetical protein
MSEKLIADLYQAIKNITGCHDALADRKFHKHDEYLSWPKSFRIPDPNEGIPFSIS